MASLLSAAHSLAGYIAGMYYYSSLHSLSCFALHVLTVIIDKKPILPPENTNAVW